MSISRRDFLRLGGLTAVAASASACSAVGRELSKRDLPTTLFEVETVPTNPILRLLNRAGYGPTPGEVTRVQQMGFAAYLEEQLAPEAIEDTAVDILIRNFSSYQMDPTQLVEIEQRDALFDLIGSTFIRAVYSKKQLYEAMVEFWSDHFNIYVQKVDLMPMLKILDDRDTIRPHALGKFRDLLWASAKSPAMLVYLDNIKNEKSAPNENYARELMELHTLGVDGGYAQNDVQELARALTGWTVGKRGRNVGKVIFQPDHHDDGQKTILGHTLPAGQGEADLDQVLEILLTHPATAYFIATKLVRRFVADDPPPALVEQVAQTFVQTDGDIKSMLQTLFLSPEFANAPPKLKRPFSFMVSTLRVLQADIRLGRGRELGRWMQQLGQPLFHWPPPNGYPDISAAWTANLLPRWNFTLAILHNSMDTSSVPLEKLYQAHDVQSSAEALRILSGLINGRMPTPTEQQLFDDYLDQAPFDDPQTQTRLRDAVALMLAGPAFQWS